MNKLSLFFPSLLAFLFSTLLLASSCQQIEPLDVNALDEGTITKQDFALCACCGGWFIEIGDETYRMPVRPADAELDLSSDNLPMDVLLRWELETDPCLGDEIIVSEIRKKE